MRKDTVVKLAFSRPFDVSVSHDIDENVWVAVCDELGLVTEASSYEELTERVWEIAPELYKMNGLGTNPKNITLSFNQEQAYSERLAL